MRNSYGIKKLANSYLDAEQFSKIDDFDGLKTYMNTADNLTANQSFQNVICLYNEISLLIIGRSEGDKGGCLGESRRDIKV